MAIYRLLQEASFAPEDIRRMGEAYEAAVSLLHLKNRRTPFAIAISR